MIDKRIELEPFFIHVTLLTENDKNDFVISERYQDLEDVCASAIKAQKDNPEGVVIIFQSLGFVAEMSEEEKQAVRNAIPLH